MARGIHAANDRGRPFQPIVEPELLTRSGSIGSAEHFDQISPATNRFPEVLLRDRYLH